MGFERVAAVIQSTNKFTDFSKPVSNYNTDVFSPIFTKIEELSGKQYKASLPSKEFSEQEQIDIAFRVVGDHIRALSFSIADGIIPGNTDRNYVLRRILRRAVRYGRNLGFQEPFFYKLVDVLADSMGDIFPELQKRRELVQQTILAEEESFNRTLDKGIDMFNKETIKLSGKELTGEFAFKLYDTYGFPLDLTQLMAREAGLSVDIAGFEALMQKQRERARSAQKKEVISVSNVNSKAVTEFVGFEQLTAEATVLEVVQDQGLTGIVLDLTPFYAEMGGQVGDKGKLSIDGEQWQIIDTQKAGDALLHSIKGKGVPKQGAKAQLTVDVDNRCAIQRHHTVTHLFHWALHQITSPDVSQKGSYVGADKLTFDFNRQALTKQQIVDIETLVNERILENATVSWTEVQYADITHRDDIMQFFGDKYGNHVRVVQIGGESGVLNGYSMELCGGTHTRATGEIGLFRITGEYAIAAGVRRIEATAGLISVEQARATATRIATVAEKLNSPIKDLEKKIEHLLDHSKKLEKQIKGLQQSQAAEIAKRLIGETDEVGAIPFISANLGAVDCNLAQNVADLIKNEFKGVIVLGTASNDSVSLVATVPEELIDKAQAGRIIQAIAPIVGGKGGGKPTQARGGGNDSSKLDKALAEVPKILTK